MADSGESSARQICGFTAWLPAGHVFLEHADVPRVNQVANARTYLAIVSDAVRKMSKSDDHPLSVVFPGKSREQIGWLLRSQRNRGSQDRWVASDTDQISLARSMGFAKGSTHPTTAISCPPGKSAMSCPALSEKIFLFSSDPNHHYNSRRPVPTRGALRGRHGRWARDAMDAKCRALSLARNGLRSSDGRLVARSHILADFADTRARRKPLKPLRREGRLIRHHLW
jgi:hypothetical protein